MISTTRKFEHIHILLWLLKDTAWLMNWKGFGLFMILPTVMVAILIAVKDYNNRSSEFWIQLSVCM
ncbi:MAG: hypothetical protein IPM48_14130 [Saprospiraceae bacterium]|nr:hypothetical protein [Saprospiraceae bacterium]